MPPPLPPSPDAQRSEEDQRAFFDAVDHQTRKAFAAAREIEHFIEVAGMSLRLVFAGPRLGQEFMPALAHLATSPVANPDATLQIWDSASTGIPMIPPPCQQTAFTDRGDIWGFSSLAIRSAFHWSEYSVSLLDTAEGRGIYWIDNVEALPYWAKSSPMRSLFHWLMEARGLQLVHAAAVGTEHGGVLITGKGGVGKSTTALAGLTAGMFYIGDDYLIVGLDPEPRAFTLYSTAKLELHQVNQFPQLAPLVGDQTPGEGEKVVLYLYPTHQPQIVGSLPLKWILTPGFGEGLETHFEPISAVELHRAAAFTTMSQLPHAGLKTHDFIGAMIARTPGCRIRLGRDILGVPKAIAGLLSEPQWAPPTGETLADQQPLISVVIPVFNGAHFLHEAVASVLAQNYSALEIIIVDDGSSDEIEDAVKALPVDVRFFRQPNQGPAAARNRGIRDASGRYIAFLDVDDLWPADNLTSLVAALQASEAQVVCGRGQLAQIIPPEEGGLKLLGSPQESFPYYIGAALYCREAFQNNGLFDEDMRFGEDTDWYRRAQEKGLLVTRLDQVTLIVRRHGANMTEGKSLVELHVLRVAKKALDRRRALNRGD